MKKKFQIFVSSTYSDLIEERQSCVEAILRAGHIPAGMELFSAGDESQLETIKKWIEDCEIYMLLLGGRYGSIEPKSKLSYTEIEYRYASELGIPLFSIVMSDEFLNKKVKDKGKDILELENGDKYNKFKSYVLSKVCRFFNDNNEIKLSILESILDIQNRNELNGWVKENELPNIKGLLSEIDSLKEENKQFKEELKVIESNRINKIGDFSFEELKSILSNIIVKIPDGGEFDEIGIAGKKYSILKLSYLFKVQLAKGLHNNHGASKLEMYIINQVIPHLRIYDLSEIVKIPGMAWTRFQTSKLGNKFLAMYSIEAEKSGK